MLKRVLRYVTPRRVWEQARLARIRRRVASFQRRTERHTFGGYELNVIIADSISEGWYGHDWPTLTELSLLADGRLEPGATVFDLGAHQGVVAMMIAKTVGPDGKVVAVEGMSHNCEVANANQRLNGIDNVEVVRAVVSDEAGKTQFFEGLNGSVARDNVGEMIDAVTIDGLAASHGSPDVVFVDIEGYEWHALRSATETLATGCDWFVEIHKGCGLEEYGGTDWDVVSVFDPDRYDRYLLPLDGSDGCLVLKPSDPLPEGRFGLVALCRR